MSLLPPVERMTHRRGVPWHDAPKPRRWLHFRHVWETKGWIPDPDDKDGYWIMRCACGATSYSDIGGWTKERKPRFR